MTNDAQRNPGGDSPLVREWESPLRGISIFQCFRATELNEIYACGKEQTYRYKTNILIEGERSRGLYVLLNGNVSVYKNDPETGALMRIATLDSGAQFGEFSLFDHAPRSATVTAESACQMFVLEAQAFEAFLANKGDEMKVRFYQTCAEVISSRFRKLNNDYIHAQQLLWKHALRK
jgi:CRP-like cAMP-binding protein